MDSVAHGRSYLHEERTPGTLVAMTTAQLLLPGEAAIVSLHRAGDED